MCVRAPAVTPSSLGGVCPIIAARNRVDVDGCRVCCERVAFLAACDSFSSEECGRILVVGATPVIGE